MCYNGGIIRKSKSWRWRQIWFGWASRSCLLRVYIGVPRIAWGINLVQMSKPGLLRPMGVILTPKWMLHLRWMSLLSSAYPWVNWKSELWAPYSSSQSFSRMWQWSSRLRRKLKPMAPKESQAVPHNKVVWAKICHEAKSAKVWAIKPT